MLYHPFMNLLSPKSKSNLAEIAMREQKPFAFLVPRFISSAADDERCVMR